MSGQGAKQEIASAGAVHSLPQEESRKALPVHIQGIVTFYDPLITSLFVEDPTGAIYVSAQWNPPLPLVEGTRVDVTGVTDPGEFAAIVGHAQIRILGQSRPPRKPPQVTVPQLATGAYDCRWVEVEGVVHSLSRAGHMMSLRLATRDGTIVGLTPAQPGVDYSRWLDSHVRMRGVAAAEYNQHMQMTGSHLFVPGMDDLKVLSYRRGDPFATRLRSIGQLAQFDPHVRIEDGVHVRGRVVLQWPGRLLCLQDASGGLCIEDTSNLVFASGEMLDVFGYPVFAAESPALMDATVRRSGGVAERVVVEQVTLSEARVEAHSGELVAMEGKLVGISADAEFWQLTLVWQNQVFSAVLPKQDGAGLAAPWLDGSYVRITGVCRNEVDARIGRDWTSKQRMASSRLLMRTSADVTVLRKPSWWTPAHTYLTLGTAVLATMAVFGWVVLLQRRVEQRTRELKESETRFRHLAHHDSLTGVPNRAWFHERASRALDLSRRRGGCVGLLLLDLDHFKPVNDTLGHDAGDAMLCALAERVSDAIRKVDTVARLGGDEFAVVLVDVRNDVEAERVARKILAAICRPVAVKGQQIPMSASIGVAVFPYDGDSVAELLRSADLAMYESKKRARGGVRRYRPEATSDQGEAVAEVVGS